MPENQFNPTPVFAEFLPPDDRLRTDLLVDYEMGGVDIGDPSEGLQVQVWEARVSAGVIQTRPEGAGTWSDITGGGSITEIALAFDQNMRPSVAYVDGGVAKHYWFDADAGNFVTTSYADATSPVVAMDDKRDMQIGINDVLLFYLRDGRVKHRLQRDRYLIEYDLAAVPTDMTRIVRWGMTEANRVQLEFGTGLAEFEPLPEGAVGALYTDLLTDDLYVVMGASTEVLPMFAVGRRTGVWRSAKFQVHYQGSYAWARVNGNGSFAVTVRVIADGVEVWSDVCSLRTPMRLPAIRGRVWELEVEGASEIIDVTLAASSEELNR